MKIHIYSTCWNEIRILPYYIRHYQPIVERFIIGDDSSSDGSIEFLKRYPNVELDKLRNQGGLFSFSTIKKNLKFWDHRWKNSRSIADWVIICSIDEHLYHNNLLEYLKHCQKSGVTILSSLGFEMVSAKFPQVEGRLCDTVVTGAPSHVYNKICVFNPNEIKEINYIAGRHGANPTGNVVFPKKTEIKLLHYKFLGTDYVKQRYAELKTGMRLYDRLHLWGYQYSWNENKIKQKFNKLYANASRVIDLGSCT